MHILRLIMILALILFGYTLEMGWAAEEEAAPKGVATQANVMVGIPFTSQTPHADPFNDVTLDVIITDPTGAQMTVPAFWAGGVHWTVRYASPVLGVHTYRTICSDAGDAGLHGITGSITVSAYAGTNPLYAKGPARIIPGSRYFTYGDGTPFFWLGDTWWMGLTARLGWPDEFATLAADRIAKGFTVVQMVAGLYPNMNVHDDPRARNENGLPWEPEYARIRPEYFEAADRRILYLIDHGITPCVVPAWISYLSPVGERKMEQHERYVYARWGALPTMWAAGGEVNNSWAAVIAYLRSINCFGRPLSAHPQSTFCIRRLLKDPSIVSFDMLQTEHGQMDIIAKTAEIVRSSYDLPAIVPTVEGEPSYEMLWNKTPAAVSRRVFWVCWASGVKGYTYGANGIWQLNRPNDPFCTKAGDDGHGGADDWGDFPWEQAMHLPGSSQVALGAALLRSYPWEHFEPHRTWAAWETATDVGNDRANIPYAFGIADGVRLVYVPERHNVALNELPVGKRYRALGVDAVDGKRTPLSDITADANGIASVKPPPGDLDWILVLEPLP